MLNAPSLGAADQHVPPGVLPSGTDRSRHIEGPSRFVTRGAAWREIAMLNGVPVTTSRRVMSGLRAFRNMAPGTASNLGWPGSPAVVLVKVTIRAQVQLPRQRTSPVATDGLRGYAGQHRRDGAQVCTIWYTTCPPRPQIGPDGAFRFSGVRSTMFRRGSAPLRQEGRRPRALPAQQGAGCLHRSRARSPRHCWPRQPWG